MSVTEPDDTGVPGDTDPEFVTLDCSAVLADVWLLLDNECDPGARSRIRGHIDNCPSCLEHYGIERDLKALISRKCGGDEAPVVCGNACASRSVRPSSPGPPWFSPTTPPADHPV